mmetsp:Transcript_5222/g.11617  ORF Transcript_5222/g.11617 Transcript_5222/m.11617 type:complete len:241 (-) Transcript_5222:113-835(-)
MCLGSLMLKVDPFPTSDSTVIDPPWSTRISLQMHRPRPLPLPRRATLGWKILSRSSAAIPHPVSETRTMTQSSCSSPDSFTVPASVKVNALWTTWYNTRLNLTSSPLITSSPEAQLPGHSLTSSTPSLISLVPSLSFAKLSMMLTSRMATPICTSSSQSLRRPASRSENVNVCSTYRTLRCPARLIMEIRVCFSGSFFNMPFMASVKPTNPLKGVLMSCTKWPQSSFGSHSSVAWVMKSG